MLLFLSDLKSEKATAAVNPNQNPVQDSNLRNQSIVLTNWTIPTSQERESNPWPIEYEWYFGNHPNLQIKLHR